MKKILLILLIITALTGYAQNNAPVAVNDTFFIDFNDTTHFQEISNGSPSGKILINDSDPDGNSIFPTASFYNGTGTHTDSIQVISPTFLIWRINYTPPLNFVGIDSIQYVIRDNGAPIMYDTATIYLKVKHQEFEYIDLNNIKARLELFSLFSDVVNSISAFEVPKGSNRNTIFAANLWIAGKNQDSTFANCETFGSLINNGPSLTSFGSRSGPIMDSVHYPQYSYQWDRLWKVTNYDIQNHINNWNNSGYQPVEVIANWPAHGDTSKGQAYYLAPFIDSNNDGLYNPLDGDYPKIKGQQAVYNIYNDVRAIPGSSSSMTTEIHYMAYAYNCSSDSAINNTIFLDYTVYNRSNLTYDSTYIGMWTDFDIGGATDDYVGCDVARSSFYGYNGTSVDLGGSGALGYGNHPPAQSVTFLQGAKQDNDNIDNPFTQNIQDVLDSSGTPYTGLGTGFGDNVIDNEHWGMEHSIIYSIGAGATGDPASGLDYYNYLRGYWGDSTQMVWGGNGNSASSGGTDSTKYIFPGISDPLLYGTRGITPPTSNWSEVTAGNPPGDRRGLGSSGPFTFYPDSSVSITLAFVFGRDYQNLGAQAGVVVMQERIDSIRSYFNTDFVSVCGGTLSVSEKNEDKNNLLIYPNPFNNTITINYELEKSIATLAVYNIIGEQITTQKITSYTTIINLANQPNGIYFITITDGNNRITKKIVKQ